MPKELARVMADYRELQAKVKPVLSQLRTAELEYYKMSDYVIAAAEELAGRLTELKAKTAADPQAANDRVVKGWLGQIDKFRSLKQEQLKVFDAEAKKVRALSVELMKFEKDVAAVIKAKSGIFTRSKSLPALNNLSKNLKQLGADMAAAIDAKA
jgi:hypothetical protein